MPRLQITRRTSLLSTNLRAAFLEAFGRNISANATSFGTRRPSDVIDLHAVARHVQVEIRRTTGRFCPLSQVLWSIQDLASDRSDNSTSPADTLSPPTPRPIPIVITSTTPTSSRTFAADASVSRFRIACNRPPLQFQLSMPPRVSSISPLSSPGDLSPMYTVASAPFICHSHLSRGNISQPITPIDQIARTPLTPPKLPRLVPPAPGTWSRLNVEARRDGLSPLETPTLPLAPHLLGPTLAGKPVLGRLHIPDAPKEPGLHRSASALLTPSPKMLSPFDLGRGQLQLLGAHSSASASSSLTRAALLRPALARSFSQTLRLDLRSASTFASDCAVSPLLSPFASPGSRAALGSPLASPFGIRPEGEYFCV